MKRLRICFISSFPPNRARLSEYAQNLVGALASRPTINFLYLIVDKSSIQDEVFLNSHKFKLLRVWKQDNIPSILWVMWHILRLKPDVVHFNVSFQSFGKDKLTNLSGLSLILLCRIFGFKVLAGLHTLAQMSDLKKFQVNPSLLNRVGILIATKIILSAQSVVVLVRSYGNFLEQRYKHKGIKYIPHGASVSKISKLNSYEKVILVFGHMGPHKGLPVIIEAFEKLRKEEPNAKLIIAGDNHPNFPNYLNQFIQKRLENVEFTGYVPQNKLGLVFRSAKMVVLPYSAAPGTSGVFHLACGFGLPIVASDLPEIRELVNDGASAILIPPGNVNKLKDAILKILSDNEIATKMSERNLDFARRESWSAVAKAYEDAYVWLISS